MNKNNKMRNKKKKTKNGEAKEKKPMLVISFYVICVSVFLPPHTLYTFDVCSNPLYYIVKCGKIR